MLTERQRTIVRMRDEEGMTFPAIAKALNSKKQNVHRSYKGAQAKLAEKKARLDPGIHGHLEKFGLGDLAGNHSGWIHKEDPDTGEWVSTHYYLGKDGTPSEADLEDMLKGALERVAGKTAKPVRPKPTSENLLVIDIADLHIGKLSIASETGFSYSSAVALERGREGLARLLGRAKKHGVGHILFILGNDILHIDRPDRRTTAGTPQDTCGTLHTMFDDAFAFYVEAIDACRRVAPVSLVYAPSNHDWFAGYTLVQSVKAWFRRCPEVTTTDYNLSPRHRKYFAFGSSLIGIAHGDGAKEADLVGLMLEEAGTLLATCPHRYWVLHHLHHKIAKRGAGTARYQAEKDLSGAMTIIRHESNLRPEGAPEIEYVRSPSAPDGWHDRNGYVNRQAVECFMHDPGEGQFARFTEWF